MTLIFVLISCAYILKFITIVLHTQTERDVPLSPLFSRTHFSSQIWLAVLGFNLVVVFVVFLHIISTA